MIRVVLADDHKLVRDGIKSLLREDKSVKIVAEAANGKELLELMPHTRVHVVLMDINMPLLSGLEATRLLIRDYPAVKVLVLSMLSSEYYIRKMLELGASGYLLKNINKDELLHAIHTVAGGNTYICSEIAIALLNKQEPLPPPGAEQAPFLRDLPPGSTHELSNGYHSLTNGFHEIFPEKPATPPPFSAEEKAVQRHVKDELSKRELEVLRLIAEGLTNAEIAEKLFTSKRTIDGHRQSIIEKTNARNTAALIKYAVAKGLLN